jgi:hypothetical protein
MSRQFKLPDGTVVTFPEHLTDAQITERVRAHAALLKQGVSRSPRAMPVALADAVPTDAQPDAKRNFNFKAPPRGAPVEQKRDFIEESRERSMRQYAAFDRVYGRHRGR